MPWGRIDDNSWRNRKFNGVSAAARGLYWCAISYSNEYLLDGILSPDDVDTLCRHIRATEVEVEELLTSASPLWIKRGDGSIEIHDYLVYNDSKAEVEEKRKKKAEAGALGGIASGETRRSKNEAESKQTRSKDEAESKRKRTPGTRYPVPGTNERSTEVSNETSAAPSAAAGGANASREDQKAWDELIKAGLPKPKTPSERGKWNKGISQILAAGETSADISELVYLFRERFPSASCTPTGIASNLGLLRSSPPNGHARAGPLNGAAVSISPYIDEDALAKRRQEDEEWTRRYLNNTS